MLTDRISLGERADSGLHWDTILQTIDDSMAEFNNSISFERHANPSGKGVTIIIEIDGGCDAVDWNVAEESGGNCCGG